MGAEATTEKDTVNALYFQDEFEPALSVILSRSGLTLNRIAELDHSTDDKQHIKGWVVGLAVEVQAPESDSGAADDDTGAVEGVSDEDVEVMQEPDGE